jgi:hypothetical protein
MCAGNLTLLGRVPPLFLAELLVAKEWKQAD